MPRLRISPLRLFCAPDFVGGASEWVRIAPELSSFQQRSLREAILRRRLVNHQTPLLRFFRFLIILFFIFFFFSVDSVVHLRHIPPDALNLFPVENFMILPCFALNKNQTKLKEIPTRLGSDRYRCLCSSGSEKKCRLII